MTDRPGPSRAVSRPRVSLTVVLTLLVVVGEFLLLAWVYRSVVPLRTQAAALAEARGLLEMAGPADGLDVSDRTLDLLATATGSGLPAGSATAATRAAAAAATDPGALAQLREEIGGLQQQVVTAQHAADVRAYLIFGGLILVASVGWMVWFRRLVERHRQLEHQVTTQTLQATGERRLAALVRGSSDVVAVLRRDGVVGFATPSTTAVLGVTPEDLVGTAFRDVVVDEDRPAFDAQLARAAVEDVEIRMRVRPLGGDELYVEGTLADLTGDDAVGGVVLTVRDVTQRVRLEQRLTYQAFHDSLTGLSNRRLFTDRLDHALARPGGGPVVVLLLDLDDFKLVNDDLGHLAGDAVLVEVARRVLRATRVGDTVARLGGDEFAILMESTTEAEGLEAAERVALVLTEDVVVDATRRRVRTSVGLATATPGEGTGEEALRRADVALYQAKSRGKSGIAVYEPRLHHEAHERTQLIAELEHAIGAGQLELHFQPVVDLPSNAMIGFEALVRWRHPTRGLLPPAAFVPMAEQTGLILGLGRWVLRAACEAAVRLGPGPDGPSIAVNVAAQQLAEDDVHAQVVAALADTGLAPHRLVLEITESVVLGDLGVVLERLRALRGLGVRIAIDDFGTGYSSLAYLSRLPLDVLKVDKSFIDRVVDDGQDAVVTLAVIAMSSTMNLRVVAEGVETEQQAQWLRRAGCDSMQGYLFSPPVAEEHARDLLEGRTSLGGSAVAFPALASPAHGFTGGPRGGASVPVPRVSPTR